MSRLTIARRLAGLTQAALADISGVSKAWISQLESGERGASPEKLKLLADALHTSADFLAEVHPAPLTLDDCNFRSLARVPAIERDRALGVGDLLRILIDEIKARDSGALPPPAVPVARQGWGDAFGDLEDECGPEVALDSVLAQLQPEMEAEQLRRRVGLGPDEPIADMVALLEGLGAVVHAIPTCSSETIDAFSFWKDEHPVVLLNHEKKDPFRSRYDAAHELGHLVLHRDLPVTREPGDRPARTPDQRLESQANAFAGAFLVPAVSWVRDAPRSTNPYAYLPHKARWKVSIAALIVRSHRVGVLNQQQYTSAMTRYSQLGWRNGEPLRDSIPHEQPHALRAAVLGVDRKTGSSLKDLVQSWGFAELMEMLALFDEAHALVSISEARTLQTLRRDVEQHRARTQDADCEWRVEAQISLDSDPRDHDNVIPIGRRTGR